MKGPWSLNVALAVALCPSPTHAQRPSYGPLTWEEGSPLQRLAITPSFESAEVIGAGRLGADLWLGYSNIFEQDSTKTHFLFMDAERLLTATTVRFGATERLEVGGRVTWETTGGGVLDDFVLWYHRSLGFGQANRDRFPGSAYEQRLTDGGANELLDMPRRTFELEEIQAYGKWEVSTSADRRAALSLRGSIRAPVAANRAGNERAGAALMVLGKIPTGAWYLHAMLGAGMVRASPGLEGVLRDRTFFSGIAAERALGATLAVIAQYQVTSPLLRGFDHRELDWPSSNVIVGLAGRWGDSWRWDASFQEDVPADTPAIDFTLGIRVSRIW